MIKQSINLDMIPGGVTPVVYANQYDSSEGAIDFHIYANGAPYQISSSTSVLINGTKPDKNGFTYAARSYQGNCVTCDITQQMTAVHGDVECELRFKTGLDRHGTINFILRVERAALDGDTVVSDTDIPLIQQAVDIAGNLNEYIQRTKDAADEATNAAITAVAANAAAAESQRSAAFYNTNMQRIYDGIEATKAKASAAAAEALEAANTVNQKLASGELRGPKGDKGDPGECGISQTVSGLYALSVDAVGDLYVWYDDGSSPPGFSYNADTGELEYIFDDGGN